MQGRGDCQGSSEAFSFRTHMETSPGKRGRRSDDLVRTETLPDVQARHGGRCSKAAYATTAGLVLWGRALALLKWGRRTPCQQG